MTYSTSIGTLTRQVYDAFQRAEFDRWDQVIDRDVLVNSPAGFGLRGLDGLKEFARRFTTLGYRIDLIDEHEALDETGSGRAFFTFNLHWKHAQPFGGLAPTGREGTSIETLLLTVANGQVTRIDVLDGSLDLAAYIWHRGWPVPHNVSPDPIAARERLTGELHGLAPTGREGTLVETMLLTVERSLITRISIAVNTLDLPLYLWSRGVPFAHNLSPAPLVAGVDRRNAA